MNITTTPQSVLWVYQGQPCTHAGKDISRVMHLEQFSAIAVLDNGSLFAYNYNGTVRFIIRSEGPVAFTVEDIRENGYIVCHYPTLPGKHYVCVIDWQTGTMQMKVSLQNNTIIYN